jgi:membrane associated rhomboid family serine protease
MFVLIVALLVVALVVFRLMKPEERQKTTAKALEIFNQVRAARANIRPCEPLRTNLRERTSRVFVTPAIAAALVLAFVTGAADAFGNLGPQTTAGQWWRLVTAAFVPPGFIGLVAILIGLVPPALLLERLVGPAAFAAVYVAAAATGGVTQLAANPVGVNFGVTPALCGLYGLLAVVIAMGVIRPSPMTIPFLAIKRMAPAIAVFLLYCMVSGQFGGASIVGFITGLGCGAVLAVGIGERKPPVARIGAALGSTAVLTVGFAFSVGSIIDARPEIAAVVELERTTADAYNAAVEKFRQGRIKTDALVQLIEQTIVPELQAAEKRVTALDSVPKDQQPLVTNAEEFLRLRSESWRLRSEGLKTTNMLRLRQAERTERASFGALEQIKPKPDVAKTDAATIDPTETDSPKTKPAKANSAKTNSGKTNAARAR